MSAWTAPPDLIARLGRVAVVMGGWSAEREISLRSGRPILAALQAAGVDAVAVDADRQVMQRLLEGRFDRVFLILHGRGGEDGQIQGALELIGLPYTGSGVLASALAMDKLRTKLLWQAQALPTPQWLSLDEVADDAVVAGELGLPVMVKPMLEGSSIGISKVDTLAEMAPARALAQQYGPAIAECFIDGDEYTASILGDSVLPLIRMSTPRAFYDYQAKYFTDDTVYDCPCGLPPAQEAELAELCRRAFASVGGRGWGRVDFMLDSAGKPWLIEVNTAPGMTDHSLVPMAAGVAGIEFEELVLRILAQTLEAKR